MKVSVASMTTSLDAETWDVGCIVSWTIQDLILVWNFAKKSCNFGSSNS